MVQIFDDLVRAVGDISDGSTVMVSGFGSAGEPRELVEALIERALDHVVEAQSHCASPEAFAPPVSRVCSASRAPRVISRLWCRSRS